MSSIFLSYARGDDEPFVRRLFDSLVALRDEQGRARFDVWFDRVSMPSRSLTFHQEIRDAIAAVERVLLVVGPKAVTSDYVCQEWTYAYFEAEKIVTPILRLGDYPLIPDELKLLHCEDFRDPSGTDAGSVERNYQAHLKELIRILSDPPPRLGGLIAMPSLPLHFFSRTDRLMPLRDALRADLDRPIVISGDAAKVGMHGMIGIGKSVLAALLARDRKVREAFPDGIIWVRFGSQPDVRALQQRVHTDLGGDGAIANEHEGKTKLKELLRDKAVLFILDDVWRRGDVDAFDVLGSRCRQLITTLNADLLQAVAGVHHAVELLSDAEATRLLALAAGCELDNLPPEAHEILQKSGRLPLAVQLAGGMIRTGTPWSDVRDALREHKLEFLADAHAANDEYGNLWQAIEVSVSPLSAETQQRLTELAVFPADEQIPERVVTTLWQHTGRLSPREARKLLVDLKQRSLVEWTPNPRSTTEGLGKVSLHTLIYDFAVRLAESRIGDPTKLHTLLLNAYRAEAPTGWWNVPNDEYLFTHLRDHLVAAQRGGELAELLQELRWLEAKNAAGLVYDLTRDSQAAIQALPEKDERRRILQLLETALRRDINFIHRHRKDYPQGLFQCLWNHGWWYECGDEGQQAYEAGQSSRLPGIGNSLDRWQTSIRRTVLTRLGVKDKSVRESLQDLLERWREARERAVPGFSWLNALRPLPGDLDSAQQLVLRGHEYYVTGVAFSPDGAQIVSGSWDQTVRVWDSRSGAEIQVIRGHEGCVQCVAFSPDGARIASGSWDRTIRLWDVRTGAEIRTFAGHESWVTSVAFSPDGARIASASSDRTVRIWDARTGDELQIIRGPEAITWASVAFSPDGTRIASGLGDKTVRVWDAQTGAELQVLRGHEGDVCSVAFSPDGARIASGSGDRTVRIWEAQTGAELQVFREHSTEGRSVAFSPDGSRLACGGSTTVCVWDTQTGATLQILRGHDEHIWSVVFSPDGKRIVTGSWDQTVRVWDVRKSAELEDTRRHEERVLTIAFSPDGKRISTGSYDCNVRLWDARTGAALQILRGHSFFVASVVFSPDGAEIASASWDKTVRLWDARTGAVLRVLRDHKGYVWNVTFSSDGTRIASGCAAGTINLWNAQTGVKLTEIRGHQDGVKSVAFSPDGKRIASASGSTRDSDHTVRVWDAQTGAELHVLSGHEGCVTDLAFSPDGMRIASGSWDRTIRVWDTQTGAELQVLRGLEALVDSVAFSSDGLQIAGATGSAGSVNNTIRVWDTRTGACVKVVRGIGDVRAVAQGAKKFPWHALDRDQEIVVERAAEGEPVAWFPEPLGFMVAHPSGRLWAGLKGAHFYLLRLEGAEGNVRNR